MSRVLVRPGTGARVKQMTALSMFRLLIGVKDRV